ncbi:MAG: hypothetical protein AAFY88_12985 [Acidobacteriota bacterium]
MSNSPHCCEASVPSPGGFTQDGERWNCPTCGTRWIHVIEEPEGFWWERVDDYEEDDQEAA